jgi:hypothetical protein
MSSTNLMALPRPPPSDRAAQHAGAKRHPLLIEDLRAFRDVADAKGLDAAARWASALELCKQEQACCCMDGAGAFAATPEQHGLARGLTDSVYLPRRGAAKQG